MQQKKKKKSCPFKGLNDSSLFKLLGLPLDLAKEYLANIDKSFKIVYTGFADLPLKHKGCFRVVAYKKDYEQIILITAFFPDAFI